MSDLFGAAGQRAARSARGCRRSTRARVDSLLRLIDRAGLRDRPVRPAGRAAGCAADPGYRAIQAIPGVGPVLAAVFVAEIGDVARFPRAAQLASLGRADPEAPRVRHHRAPRPDHQAGLPAGALGRGRGRASGSAAHTGLGQLRDRVADRRGRNIGVVAAARELIELVFYGLRDGHIRALAHPRQHERHPQSSWSVRSCRS